MHITCSYSLWTRWGSVLVLVLHLRDITVNLKDLADPPLDMKQRGPHVAKALMRSEKRDPTDEGEIGAVAWVVTVRTKSK